ncbi:MAG: hypothetical protein ACFFAE_00765, partial [Candidatus Hodarchaeota archaeon]
MKRRKMIMIMIMLFLGLNNWALGCELQLQTVERFTNKMVTEPRTSTLKATRSQSYIERAPITITSDFQLNNSGFPGNGTIDDPIRIEWYNITSTSGDLIYIRDTTFYF